MNAIIKAKYRLFNSIFQNVDTGKKAHINLLLKSFYLILFYLSLQGFSPYGQTPDIIQIFNSFQYFEPLWPITFIKNQHYEIIISFIFIGFLIITITAFLIGNKYRIIRFLVFVFYFFYLSVIFSFGKIDHYHHVSLIISFFLIFIPSFKSFKDIRRLHLEVLWFIILFILCTYSSSGLFKFWGIIEQPLLGETNALDPSTLAEFSAKTSIGHNHKFFLTDFILTNVSFFYSILIFLAYFIELISVFIAFLPSLHRIWGIILISFHTFNLLAIGADFSIQILMVGLFLVLSPFYNSKQKVLYPYAN